MHLFNYKPMRSMFADLIEYAVGVTSTHPNAAQWEASYVEEVKQYLGDDVYTLLHASVTHLLAVWVVPGNESEENLDNEAAIMLAIDKLAVLQGKRPVAWVPNGDLFAVFEFKGLDNLLDQWAGAERIAALADEDGPGEADIREVLDVLTERLPDFGNPEGVWTLMVESEAGDDPHESFVVSNVSSELAVNGRYVQWHCAQGRATAWQGTHEQKPY